MVSLLIDSPRWLLLGLLVYAPWAYGCTRPWTAAVLDWSLATGLVLWLARSAWRRAWPVVHPCLLAGAAALMVQAWWMTFNASSSSQASSDRWLSWAPGSIDGSLSWPAALRLSLMLGVVALVCDAGRHGRWRQRLWWTMGLAGSSIAAFGLVQKAADAPGIFWKPYWTDAATGTFFATFAYHGNAGSYLNLVWPLVAGLAFMAFVRAGAHHQRATWLAALVCCLAAVFVNTSRASSFLAAILLLVLAGIFGRRLVRERSVEIRLPAALAGLMALVVLAGGLAAAAGNLQRSAARWAMLNEQLSPDYPRWQMTRLCLRLAGKAGWLGSGPGTFTQVLKADLPEGEAAEIRTWRHAHQDYLQAIIEWGWLGGLVWSVLVLGAVTVSIRARRHGGQGWSSLGRTLYTVVWAALTGLALHATVDYPLHVPSIQLYAAVMLGLLWSSPGWSRSKRADRAEPGWAEAAAS